jgi:hypothetical protein
MQWRACIAWFVGVTALFILSSHAADVAKLQLPVGLFDVKTSVQQKNDVLFRKLRVIGVGCAVHCVLSEFNGLHVRIQRLALILCSNIMSDQPDGSPDIC